MGDSPLLKGALFVLCIVLVLVLFMPKNCSPTALMPLRVRHTSSGSTEKGLRIESSTPAPGSSHPQRPIDFPAGLDGGKVEYLIEADPKFAAPLALPLSRNGSGDARLVGALATLGFLQRQSDGTVTLTNDALIKLDALVDTGNGWMVPLGRRSFVRLDSSTNCGSDQCSYLFAWKWDPNVVGTAMQLSTELHDGMAVISGGEHHWGVTDLQRIDQN